MKIKTGEHIVAKEIANILIKRGCSYEASFRILKDAKNELKKLPLKKEEFYCEEPEEKAEL